MMKMLKIKNTISLLILHHWPCDPTSVGLACIILLLQLTQGTCRLSWKMGRGDEQKPQSDVLYQTVINIDLRSSEMPPLPNNGTFKTIRWTFADPLNRL